MYCGSISIWEDLKACHVYDWESFDEARLDEYFIRLIWYAYGLSAQISQLYLREENGPDTTAQG